MESAVNIYLVCVPYSCCPTSWFTHLVHAGYLNDRWHERASNTMASKTILSVRASMMIPLRGGPGDPFLFVTEIHSTRSNQRLSLINVNRDDTKIRFILSLDSLYRELWESDFNLKIGYTWTSNIEINFLTRWRKCCRNIVKRSSTVETLLQHFTVFHHSDPAKNRFVRFRRQLHFIIIF